jgi:hypothetical protein
MRWKGWIYKIGAKFNMLTIISDLIRKDGCRFYKCKCECGVVIEARVFTKIA